MTNVSSVDLTNFMLLQLHTRRTCLFLLDLNADQWSVVGDKRMDFEKKSCTININNPSPALNLKTLSFQQNYRVRLLSIVYV
mmetsp:Transcript_2049/g.5433  ORF Transcript_2049/g.5433 Transcript_2049/m.5433 type:complete len:82 (-) Transcript_2049:7-252(-)